MNKLGPALRAAPRLRRGDGRLTPGRSVGRPTGHPTPPPALSLPRPPQTPRNEPRTSSQRTCLCSLMDKSTYGMDIWTTLQVDHMATPTEHLTTGVPPTA